MRLAPRIIDGIGAMARDAIAGERLIEIGASSPSRARQIHAAVSPLIEQRGGTPAGLGWNFPNGSRIVVRS